MHYRPLGKTGIRVSEIGFGTWGLGGDAYGPTDDRVSVEALERAFGAGVNFFDTSDLYGNGHSEELLGRVFRRRRDKIVIATKGGMLPHRGFRMPQDFSPAHLGKALEASLKRMKTDYVDLYQLHSPPREVIDREEVLELLEDFRCQGKIRCYGISARCPDDALYAVEKYAIPVVQVNFNLLDQRALENGLFSAAAGKTGIIARTPLVFGFLSDALKADHEFCGRDHRANWPLDQRRRWVEARHKFAFLWRGTGRSQVQAALRFILDFGAVSTTIPGMLTPGQVDEDVLASNLPRLSPKEHERISAIYHGNDFYDQSAKQRGNGAEAA